MLLGQGLGARRGEVVVATKFGHPLDEQRRGASPAHVRRALDDSLRRLGTDCVDLYQLHRPDPETPIADTLAELDNQVRAGKVREIGCSNFSAEQLRVARAAVRDGAARFVSVQNEYSILQRDAERDVLPECRRSGLAFIPFYPLVNGVLTGKYRPGEPPPPGPRLAKIPAERSAKLLAEDRMATVRALGAFAGERGVELAALAVAWLLAQRAVASVIAGASAADQVRANARVATVELTGEDLRGIDGILGRRPAESQALS